MFDYRKRLKNLRLELGKSKLDSFLVTNETNVSYLSGFTGDDSVLLITPDSQFFLTDSRYTEEAKDSVKGFVILEVTSSIYDAINTILRRNRIRRMGFESMSLPFDVVKRLEGRLTGVKLPPVNNIVEGLRSIKDKEEIRSIKRSVSLTKKVLKTIVGSIRPGLSEKYLSDRIECEFINRGARVSFQVIVSCGKNCSKPHARPTCKVISKDDVLMIDIGCKLGFYNSDITRMVLMGKISAKIKEIYNIVRIAQEKAISEIRPGRKIADVDSAGRNYITEKGYGKFFGHSIGHGVGMEVHEEPSVSRRNSDILKPGMVFTVEPAIYIPKFGGVRIEDMVLVTNKGCKILTR